MAYKVQSTFFFFIPKVVSRKGTGRVPVIDCQFFLSGNRQHTVLFLPLLQLSVGPM